ncbi:MAG: hypothetical protein AB1714_00735 [Acidobacteriota bacterium]
MPLFVAVIAASTFADPGELKRLLLLFERLALDLTQQHLTLVERRALSLGKNDFEFLRKEGLLTTVEGTRAADRKYLPEVTPDPQDADVVGLQGIGRVLAIAAGRVGPAARIQRPGLRQLALHLRETRQFDAVAAGRENQVSIDAPADRGDVVRITLNALPTPSDLTPWEAIAEFRRDPDSILKHMRLKDWINKVAKLSVPIHELEDELLHLQYEYEEFMKSHRIKSTKGIVEVLVTTAAEIAEDLVKMKWGKMAKAPFEVVRQRAALYEAERQAPGREVAYILKARQRFGGSAGVG